MSENHGEHWDWPLIRNRCTVEALRVLRRHHDAEEVVQEALTRAWRSRGSCRTPETPLPWCLQITRNEALRLIGRRRIIPNLDELDPDTDLADRNALRETDRTLARVDVDRALEVLSPHERLLIALRYEHDCSHAEIAARLQIPEATSRVHLHRVHKRLEALL